MANKARNTTPATSAPEPPVKSETANPQTPAPTETPVPAPATPTPPAQTEAAPEPSFGFFRKLYTEGTAEFLKLGKAIMHRVVKAREDTDSATAELKILGLQFAVLGRVFFREMMEQPAWFNRTVGDFISFTYGLKKDERFPRQAWENARIVLAIVCPDENVKPLLAEPNYKLLTQTALSVFIKIVEHKKVTVEGKLDRENPQLLKACAICEAHGDGYVKKLRAILAELEDKGTPLDPIAAAFALLQETILKAGDRKPEEGKALYFAYLAVSASWAKSGVEKETLEAWAKEYTAAPVAPAAKPETPSTPAPENVLQLQAA
jgi:hypothetical protein